MSLPYYNTKILLNVVRYKHFYYGLHTSTLCLNKNVPLLFFEQLRETLTDFDNFWHASSRRNVT